MFPGFTRGSTPVRSLPHPDKSLKRTSVELLSRDELPTRPPISGRDDSAALPDQTTQCSRVAFPLPSLRTTQHQPVNSPNLERLVPESLAPGDPRLSFSINCDNFCDSIESCLKFSDSTHFARNFRTPPAWYGVVCFLLFSGGPPCSASRLCVPQTALANNTVWPSSAAPCPRSSQHG